MSDITNSDTFQLAFAALTHLLFQLPLLIVVVSGIVLGWQNMKKHPNTSRAAITAFSIILVTTLIFSFTSVWLPLAIYQNTGSVEAVGWITTAVNLVGTITSTAAYIFLLLAVYKWRGPEEQPELKRETPRPYDVAANQYGTGAGQQG